jgi:hypothetical protein
MNVYIGCGLTAVPRESFQQYVAFIHQLAAALRASGCESVRYALIDSDPQLAEKPYEQRARLCYLWDREMVEQADAIVIDATFPSIGLGIELQLAEAKGVSVILSFNHAPEHRLAPVTYENPDHLIHELQIGEGFVSLMALGIPAIFQVIGYNNASEGVAAIVEAVSLLKRK